VRYAPDPTFDHAAPVNRRPTAPADTPPGAEERLQIYQDALDEAEVALADARNKELAAEDVRDAKKREGQFHEDCPQVGVFGGVRTTVAFQKAWIEEYAKDEERAYRLAREARRAAVTHLRKLEKQGGYQQSITRSVGGRQWS